LRTEQITAARLRLQLSDGEIRCPVKGQLAIMRCEARQLETAAEGDACTCRVFREYSGLHGEELISIPVAIEFKRRRPPRKVNTYVYERQRAVLLRLQSKGVCSFAELVCVLGNKSLTERILRMLVQEGRIERVGKAQYRVAAAT